MRGFVIGWLIAFALIGLVALGLGATLGSGAPPSAAGVTRVSPDGSTGGPPFTQEEAVDVVANRFVANSRGEEYRRELRQAARVTYHSPGHWTVRWGAASWTAHGSPRYAEPDNDAARAREAEAATGS